MSKHGRTQKNDPIDDVISYENMPLTDVNFGEEVDISHMVPQEEKASPRDMEEIHYDYMDSLEPTEQNLKTRYPKGFKVALLSYLKRNALLLSILLVLWLILGVDYLSSTYRIPVIGNILSFFNRSPQGPVLRYVTATRNGPMSFAHFMKPTLSGYLAAFVAKPLYILSLTGIILPLIMGFFKKHKPLEISFTKNIGLFVKTCRQIPGKINALGLVLLASGIALALSNLMTRNGRIDKSFMPILLAFVVLAGLRGPLPALIDYMTRKFLSLILRLIPSGLEDSFEKMVLLKIGLILGFLVSVPTGAIAERANYGIGLILFIAGASLSLVTKKEKSNEPS